MSPSGSSLAFLTKSTELTTRTAQGSLGNSARSQEKHPGLRRLPASLAAASQLSLAASWHLFLPGKQNDYKQLWQFNPEVKREAHVTLWDELETWGEREVVLAGYGCGMQAKPLSPEGSILWEHSPTCSTVGERMCTQAFGEPVVPVPREHTFCLQMHLPKGR